MKDETKFQRMAFGIEFEGVRWSISPLEAKTLLEKALSNSDIGVKLKWKIELKSVELEKKS